jgi:hypothetical protein
MLKLRIYEIRFTKHMKYFSHYEKNFLCGGKGIYAVVFQASYYHNIARVGGYRMQGGAP